MAVSFTDWNIPSRVSGTGRTKQADNCCSSRPAFINVGELGRASKATMTR